jgi:arylsulfatase A-like enzyme
MTGRSPSSLGASWDTLRQSVPGSAQTLAELLHDAGYYTAGFVNNNCVKGSYGFAQGFDRYVDDLAAREGSESWNKVRADEMNAVVLDWLADDWLASGAGRQPLFLFVYYMEPHVNYVPPAPYDTLYDPSYTGPLTGEAYGIGQAVVSGALVPSARDIDHLRALYDGEVTFWDVYLGELIEYLESNGLLENTLLVVTSDHGELFGEHGKWVHGSALYEEEIRVPLLLRYDGVIQPGQVVRAPVQSYDLMPTILAYAGLDAPAEIQAVSLQPLLDGTGGPGERVIYSELDAVRDPGHWAAWIAPSADLRSIREGGWKLIHHRGAESDDELFALPPGALHEGENLLGSQGDLAARLRRQLLDWFGLP